MLFYLSKIKLYITVVSSIWKVGGWNQSNLYMALMKDLGGINDCNHNTNSFMIARHQCQMPATDF